MRKALLAIVAVLVIAVFATAQQKRDLPAELRNPFADVPRQWEYTEVHRDTEDISIPEFNKLGEKGWELTLSTKLGRTSYYVFKREKIE